MKHIDRLIIKAKETVNIYAEKLILAFVYPDGDMWVADGRLWDGKKGSGTTSVIRKCNTSDEAIEAAHQLADQYPNDKPISIIVEDELEE